MTDKGKRTNPTKYPAGLLYGSVCGEGAEPLQQGGEQSEPYNRPRASWSVSGTILALLHKYAKTAFPVL